MISSRRILLVATVLLSRRAHAAETPTPASPEIHADRTVTLRLRAPEAQVVTVSGNWDDRKEHKPLTKGADGVWSTSVGPFPPEIYSYDFEVDGLHIADPANVRVVTSPSWGHTSLVEV